VARQQRSSPPCRNLPSPPSPGFISIAVGDVRRSAAFYEEYLGAVRDTYEKDQPLFWPPRPS
jgi:catechol-2,3-dioxygenase